MPQKILSVGQCAADDYGLRTALRGEFDVTVDACDTAAQATTALRNGAYSLLLVNRIFDRDGDSGLALIRRLKQDADLAQVPTILVSNFADSQSEAMAAGALPGFGKAELGQPKMVECIQTALSKK